SSSPRRSSVSQKGKPSRYHYSRYDREGKCPRIGSGSGRRRAGRSEGASGVDHADIPWANGPRPASSAVSARGALLHELAGAPRLAVGRFATLGRVLGDPRLGMAGAFLSLGRVLPNRYPLAEDVETYIADEQNLGRLLDYAVIVPRIQRVYEWSAEELREPRL